MEKETKTQNDKKQISKEQKEEHFLQNLDILEQINKNVSQLCEGYENGLTELAFARFRNENIGNGFSGDAYYIAPAMQEIKIEKDQKTQQPIFKLNQVQQKDATFHLDINQQQLEEQKEEEQKKYKGMSAQQIEQQKKFDALFINEQEDGIDYQKQQDIFQKQFRKQDKQFQAVYNFGFSEVPSEIIRTRKQFQNALEAAINIANLVNKLKVQKKLE
ncbi:hypothetical protein PPERSA_10155 [Pseudocohnilembus persalinus]|uniref:Vacuolar ATPase assembly protein VMA22 n=1 Tax=Pseudocohnilembus persalinus TaxID=266149 RepID=A0A0V0QLF2_PSEPJ|nr:hypothetical protein PPERSA_10155 [Pseudocohnilembus persalinus]|eukprot:KRX03074.1 hypothetical protein PPERSA_10155 [Pseudocohnilembus persalinus]